MYLEFWAMVWYKQTYVLSTPSSFETGFEICHTWFSTKDLLHVLIIWSILISMAGLMVGSQLYYGRRNINGSDLHLN